MIPESVFAEIIKVEGLESQVTDFLNNLRQELHNKGYTYEQADRVMAGCIPAWLVAACLDIIKSQ